MKFIKKTLLIILCVTSVSAQADVVVKEVPDTMPGKVLGGILGFMVGSVSGPIGAIIGGSSAWYVGGEAQEKFGLTGRAYEVRKKDGELITIRSPNQHWQGGDLVQVKNGRLENWPN